MTMFALSWLAIKRALLRRRVGRLVVEHIDGLPVVVLPDVFNPAVFRTTEVLLDAVDANVRPTMRVLDLGTGSGIVAVRAARSGARVTAVDLNGEAVRCARINAILNRVDDRVTVHHGDLFAPVENERFDVVICNPPFFRGRPAHRRDMAWRSETFLDRFCAGLAAVLADDGYALVVFSSHADEPRMLRALGAAGFTIARDRQCDFGHEVITVHRLARGGRA